MPQPFFIIGAGRSGSTFLYRVLSRHPHVALTNEARIVDGVGMAYEVMSCPWGERTPRGVLGLVNPEVLGEIVPLFLRGARRAVEDFYAGRFSGYTHWGDKLPDPFFAIEARSLWPDAKYVVVVRDPRDRASSYKSLQRVDPDVLGPRAAEMAAEGAEDWARDWRNIYAHIVATLTDHHLVRYEDLVADPEATFAALFEFLGLAMTAETEEALTSERSPRGHGTSESGEASLERWRTDLTVEEVAAVERTCGDLMDHFGYGRS